MRDPHPADTDRRTNRLGELATHLVVFVAVNAALATPDGFDPTEGHVWGWGVGLAAHALAVLGHGATRSLRLAARQSHQPAEPSGETS